MPFYDYKCDKCGCKFEVMHGMGSRPNGLRCEGCGAGDVKRVFYAVSSLKSSGGDFAQASAASSGGGCSACSTGACGSCH